MTDDLADRLRQHPTPVEHYLGDVVAQDFSELDRDEFFRLAVNGEALPDNMSFHLVSKNDDPVLSFSMEGFEAVGYQMHDWLMARTLAYYNRNGRFPSGLRAEVQIAWDEPKTAEELSRDEDDPWWIAADSGVTPIPLDGTHRLRPFLTDRTERRKK